MLAFRSTEAQGSNIKSRQSSAGFDCAAETVHWASLCDSDSEGEHAGPVVTATSVPPAT
jgi:hypothetical protein